MKINIQSTSRPVADYETCILDHSVQRFTVEIRSMGGVFPDSLKELIQKKYEVLSVEEVNRTLFITPV